MRKFYMIALLAFLFIGTTIAQDVLVVEPGLGTLNAAVAANGGDNAVTGDARTWINAENDHYISFSISSREMSKLA